MKALHGILMWKYGGNKLPYIILSEEFINRTGTRINRVRRRENRMSDSLFRNMTKKEIGSEEFIGRAIFIEHNIL